MGPFIIAICVVGGMYLAVALLHMVIFIRRPALKTDLFFALMCTCVAASILSEIGVYRAIDLSAFLPAYKMQIAFQGLQWIFLTWFVAYYTGATRRWLAMTVTAAYALAIIIHIILPNGILYSSIEKVYQITLSWGESITYASGSANKWRIVADAGWILLIYLAAESCVRMGRGGERRGALLLGAGLFVFLGLGYLHDTLVDLGIVEPPMLFNISFIGLVLVMSASLTSELVRSSALNRKVAANEKRWRSLMENVSLLVIGLDTTGRINYTNPYFKKISGYTSEEAQEKQIADFVPEEERQDLLPQLRAAQRGQIRPHSTRLFLTNDGNLKHISWFHVIERDSKNRITGTLSIGEDVTELKKAQRELADDKANTDIILSSLNTGLALLDSDLTVVWVNEMTRKAFPWDDPVGEKCYALVENRSEPCAECGALKAFADGSVYETERLNPLNNRWHHIVSIPIKDESGRIVNVLESNTDITERKQTEAARDKAMQELESFKTKLEEENIYLREELQNQSGFEEIIGQSNSLLYVLGRVKQVAESEATVLIQGETGVGKELIARAVHQSSRQSDKPFVKLNCAALPTNLVESELFGHEKGAFTGADQVRKGRFELADGGTLLLDEISELPMETQAKLLRVLQEGQFERVGGSQTLSVDVRIIATTNRNLKDEIVEGRFRSDLFYRLNVYPITVPPLRQRIDDIPLLVQYFAAQISSRMGKKIDQVPASVMAQLQDHDWPGNVRELRNVLEQAVIRSTSGILKLPKGFDAERFHTIQANPEDGFATIEELEKQHILKVLEATGWRISGPKGASNILGLNASTLRFRIKKLGISKPR
jgi:chemotaxis protein methyltransferase CheR